MGTMALGESHIITCRSDSLDFSDEFFVGFLYKIALIPSFKNNSSE